MLLHLLLTRCAQIRILEDDKVNSKGWSVWCSVLRVDELSAVRFVGEPHCTIKQHTLLHRHGVIQCATLQRRLVPAQHRDDEQLRTSVLSVLRPRSSSFQGQTQVRENEPATRGLRPLTKSTKPWSLLIGTAQNRGALDLPSQIQDTNIGFICPPTGKGEAETRRLFAHHSKGGNFGPGGPGI